MFGFTSVFGSMVETVLGTDWRPLDDGVDRLHYRVTTVMLVLFAILVGSKQHFGSPIECMEPGDFHSEWIDYMNDYCFIKNTHVDPTSFERGNDPLNLEITYYQWVPLWLAIVALCFTAPNWIWQAFMPGTDFDVVIRSSEEMRDTFGTGRESMIKQLVINFKRCMDSKRYKYQEKSKWNLVQRAFSGNMISLGSFIVKLARLLTVVLMFYFMRWFLSLNSNFWGTQFVSELFSRNNINIRLPGVSGVTDIFPITTLCAFQKIELGAVNTYTVQCVLMISMLNEKIFLILWFWFVFLFLTTLFNLLHYVLSASCLKWRRAKRFLGKPLDDATDKANFRLFYKQVLTQDCMFLLSLIEGHAGGIVAKEVTVELFSEFVERVVKGKGRRQRSNPAIHIQNQEMVEVVEEGENSQLLDDD